MEKERLNQFFELIRQEGHGIEEGLTEGEFAHIEQTLQFRFPPDLRAFLAHALPTGRDFPDWRHADREMFEGHQQWLLSGILFDLEYNDYWLSSWGERPTELDIAKQVITEQFRKAPLLIPIFAHRFMPSVPSRAGNPVFSIWQTDIICYGSNLENYLIREFNRGPIEECFTDYEIDCERPFPFWDDLYEANNAPFGWQRSDCL